MTWLKLNFLFASGLTGGHLHVWMLCRGLYVHVHLCDETVYLQEVTIWLNQAVSYSTVEPFLRFSIWRFLPKSSWIFLMQFPLKRNRLTSFLYLGLPCFPTNLGYSCTQFYPLWLVLMTWSQNEVTGSENLSKPTRSQRRACVPRALGTLHHCWTDLHVYKW